MTQTLRDATISTQGHKTTMQRRNNASITTILKTVYCVGVSIKLVRGNLDRLENLLHVYARTVCGTSVRHLFTFNHIISTYWISARRRWTFIIRIISFLSCSCNSDLFVINSSMECPAVSPLTNWISNKIKTLENWQNEISIKWGAPLPDHQYLVIRRLRTFLVAFQFKWSPTQQSAICRVA